MAWSYDSGMGANKDKVRFLIQDTNTSRQLFQDQEINWVISQEANIYMSAARLCDILVTRAGNIKSKKIGELSLTYDVSFYSSLGTQLRARGSSHQMPYAGGISQSDKDRLTNDSDATSPSIVRRLDDNPAAPAPVMPPANPITSI